MGWELGVGEANGGRLLAFGIFGHAKSGKGGGLFRGSMKLFLRWGLFQKLKTNVRGEG